MSYYFQGSFVRGDERVVRAVFNDLRVPIALRLYRFSEHVFGICPVQTEVSWEDFAAIVRRLSVELGSAVHYYYNSISGESIRLFERGDMVRYFNDKTDAIWGETDDQGNLVCDGPQYRAHELRVNLAYEYVRSPLDAALEAIGESGLVLCRDSLYRAFHMNDPDRISESSPYRPPSIERARRRG